MHIDINNIISHFVNLLHGECANVTSKNRIARTELDQWMRVRAHDRLTNKIEMQCQYITCILCHLSAISQLHWFHMNNKFTIISWTIRERYVVVMFFLSSALFQTARWNSIILHVFWKKLSFSTQIIRAYRYFYVHRTFSSVELSMPIVFAINSLGM